MSEHELWNELGNLYFMCGAYNQAVHAYERSIQANSDFGRPYSNLALTYVQQGKYDEAIDLYRRSIELLAEDKEKAISWNRLGTVYRHLKDYSHAVIAFQEADELDPHSADDFPTTPSIPQQAAEMPSSVLEEAAPVLAMAEETAPVSELQSLDADADLLDVEPEMPVASAELFESEASDGAAPLLDMEPEMPTVHAEAFDIESPDASAQLFDMQPEMPVATAGLFELRTLDVDAELLDMEPQTPLAIAETLEPEMPAVIEEASEPELEWWDVDEERVRSATQSEPDASFDIDLSNASWTAADPTEFQQDLSQMPQTGSLTTWGDADLDDDFELFPSLDPDGREEVLDPEGERISTWIPLPEEAPFNVDELRVPPFVDEDDFAEDWEEPPSYHLINSVDFGTPTWPAPVAPSIPEYVERNPVTPSMQSIRNQEVQVQVEERPAVDVTMDAQLPPVAEEPEPVVLPTPQPLEIALEAAARSTQPEPFTKAQLNPVPPELPDTERDEEEMREIEMGIAKFRRVVQVNPRNAHAWDALGTLFKSAGMYKDAILAYQQAISNDGSKSLYYHHLGLVYACEGRDEDAIGAFQRVIEIDPDYSLAHATLGGYYRKMGLEELAQKHIGKAMKSIFDSENEYNRACLEAICGNADQAIELLGVALKNKQTYVDWILRDPDLDFIRQDPRFKQLISDYNR